ncbi:MAG: hypothetical protein KDC09_07840 [Bacteroidales bacterium]|nr:hypothetical protein [Bacteroidales bacterium]
MYRILMLVLFVVGFIQMEKLTAQGNPELYLPTDEQRGNWAVKDSVQTYADEDLYLYIDGGADVYLEYGFKKVASCKYQNPSANRMHIEIYQMKDPDAAYGIFSLNSTGLGHPLDLGDLSYQYDYYLDVWKTSYFIRCTISRKEAGALDTLKLFASVVLENIIGEGKEPLINGIIQLENHPLKNLKYIRGQIALGNIFNFGQGSIAAFDQGVTARSGDLSFYVFGYQDDHKRREWFASAKGKMYSSRKFDDFVAMEDGFTVKDKTGKSFSFKPYRQFFIVIAGKDWEEAKPLFEEMMKNIDQIYP